MKHLHFILMCLSFSTFAQNGLTAKEFGLPNSITALQTMQATYNGESKELKPFSQALIMFIDGKVSVKKMTENGVYKRATESTYTYNQDGRLEKETYISMKEGDTEADKGTTTYEYITTNGITSVYRNYDSGGRQKTDERKYNADGTLDETTWFDQNGKKMRLITYNQDYDKMLYYDDSGLLSTTGMYSKVTYYIGNQIMNITTTFLDDQSMVKTLFVDEYLYDMDENLIQKTQKHQYKEATAADRRIMNEPYKPVDKNKIKPEKIVEDTKYSNYLVDKKWVIQVPNKLNGNIMDVTFRATQSADGKTTTISDQTIIMKFLDDTYQKLKAQKP